MPLIRVIKPGARLQVGMAVLRNLSTHNAKLEIDAPPEVGVYPVGGDLNPLDNSGGNGIEFIDTTE